MRSFSVLDVGRKTSCVSIVTRHSPGVNDVRRPSSKVGTSDSEGETHVPLGYHAIAGELRARIERGTYEPGSRLPAEDALAREFSVSRQTVNKALLRLRAEGLVRVERGVGTTVRAIPMLTTERIGRQSPAQREAGEARGAFQGELDRLGYTSRSVVQVTREDPPGSVREVFGTDEQAVVRRREMFAGDVPVQLATGYYPLAISAGTAIEQEDTGPGGTYSRLAELGHAPARFTERIRLRLATDGEAAFLRLDTEQRVYDVERIARDSDGLVVEVNMIVMPAHQWGLVYEWDA
jgi:GntR family transcriptional regulator